MTERAHRIRLWLFGLLTLAVMAAIFFFSAQNADESQQLSDSFLAGLIGRLLEKLLPVLSDKGMEFDIRKYAHMAEFFCLGFSSLLFADELLRKRKVWEASLCSLGFCFLYACTDEWHQIYIPGRAGRLTDVLIDGIGFSLAILLTALIKLSAARAKKSGG